MDTLNETTKGALMRIREDLSARLFRENEDYRVLLALQHAIGWLEAPPAGAEPPAASLSAAGPVASAFEMLAQLAQAPRTARRRNPPPFVDPAQGGAFSQRDLVAAILRERGEPTRITELLDLMEMRGSPVGGARPKGNLSSNLSQDRRFYPVRYRDHSCWWLVGEPIVPRNP